MLPRRRQDISAKVRCGGSPRAARDDGAARDAAAASPKGVFSFAKERTPPLTSVPVQRTESRRTEHRYANTLCKDAKRPPATLPVAFIFTFDNNKI